MVQFKWTDESVAELKILWCDKGASASVVAQMLSQKFGGYVTRNSVIGKVNRLGLSHPECKIAVAALQKKAKPVVKKSLTTQLPKIPVFLPVEPEPVNEPDDSRRIGLLDLRETTCRFPIGDPRQEGFGYCGEPSPFGGSPYCEFHHRIAYVPRQPATARKKNGDHHGMRVVQLVAY